MKLVLSVLSDNTLFLYQVLPKYLIGFQGMDLNSCVSKVIASID